MRKLIFLVLSAVLLTFAGCWDMKEINEQSYIIGLGIDAAENNSEYLFTFQKAIPVGIDSASDSNSIKYENISIVSSSLASALRSVSMSSSSEFSFEHLSCIIIGNELAHNNFSPVIEYLMQQPDVRRQCVVAVASDTAQSLFSTKPTDSAASISTASMLEELDSSRGRSVIMTLSDVNTALMTNSGFCLYIIGENVGISSSAPGVSPSDVKNATAVAGAYVFTSQETSHTLDAEKADLLRLFAREQNDGIISALHESGKTIYFRIDNSQCRITCNVIKDRLYYDITVYANCSIADPFGIDPYEIDSSLLNNTLQIKLNELISLSKQNWGSSILRLDDAARKANTRWYEKNKNSFEEYYRSSVVNLDIQCFLERSGVIN